MLSASRNAHGLCASLLHDDRRHAGEHQHVALHREPVARQVAPEGEGETRRDPSDRAPDADAAEFIL